MKRRKNLTLKDEVRTVYEDKLASLRKELSARYESMADQILKKKRKEISTSVPAVSGGRAESHRRKF